MGNDRRLAAEENYRRKFEELGLSERFEFIKREWSRPHDRRFWCKCKACGVEFLTWNDVLRGKQKHLLCPDCGAASDGDDVWERSPLCDLAMKYYCEGHTARDTAEHFGVSESKINGSVKLRRLTNGRSFHEKGRTTGANVARKQSAEKRLIDCLLKRGFDYVGGYSGRNSRVTIRCRVCGNEIERGVEFVKKGNLICPHCEHEKTLTRQAERRREHQVEQQNKKAEKEAERIKSNPLGLSYYQLEREARFDEVHVCKVCGKEYTPRQYVESTGGTTFSNPGYCSVECKKKANNKMTHDARKRRGVKDNHRHRAKIYGCKYDSSVTLPKVIKRYGLKCAICGEMCDLNDHGWNQWMGPMSPTIDHIVPMAKGGGHVWDNVQIAHAICNSYKSDHVEEVIA